jgi:hypothetical protein
MEALVMSDLKSPIADVTSHAVVGNWPEGSDLFFFNPASGAVEVHPAHRAKVARSLTRHARRMKRRLFLFKLRLQIEYFALYLRRAVFKVLRNFLRFREKTIRDSHGNSN